MIVATYLMILSMKGLGGLGLIFSRHVGGSGRRFKCTLVVLKVEDNGDASNQKWTRRAHCISHCHAL